MNAEGEEPLLKDVIDAHVHCDPDSIARDIDAVDLARLAKRLGMRGFVMKNHFEPTASVAYLVRKAVQGIEVFGGINLNRAVGGINPAAVDRMARVKGGWGRFVWMPSSDSESHVRFHDEDRPFVSVSKNGRLLPEVKQVLALVAQYDLVLATSHSSAEENLLLVREAREQGVNHIVITHAMMAPSHMSTRQMIEAADLGAYIEFSYNGLVGPHKEFVIADYAGAIRAVGPARCILSSDLGQVVNPVHPEGLLRFFEALLEEGFTRKEIHQMAIHNPSDLLGLEQVAGGLRSESSYGRRRARPGDRH
jgi:hypothetical protein